ncbi:hypothetical protein BgiMline_001187, partial [Biomphalaria glabrata]
TVLSAMHERHGLQHYFDVFKTVWPDHFAGRHGPLMALLFLFYSFPHPFFMVPLKVNEKEGWERLS